jgi:hypothetical protein
MTQEFLPPLQPVKAPKKQVKRRNAKGLFAGKVDVEKDYKRIMTVLSREVAYLMMESHKAPLTEERSKALVAYSKLIRDLREQQVVAQKEVSDDILSAKLTEK